MSKRIAARAVMLAVGAASACAALAGPAAAANVSVTVGDGGDERFAPSTVTINQGDTVTWTWEDSGHNVESESGQSETFVSRVQGDGTTFQHRFTQTGTFSYYCEPHEDDMRGTVIVRAAEPDPEPDPEPEPEPEPEPDPEPDPETPPGNGGSSTGGGSSGGGPLVTALPVGGSPITPMVDSQPPTVSRLKARRKALVFRSSENARVSVSIERLGRGTRARIVKRLRGTAKRGINRMRISGRRLARGRYRVVITARDAAGNRSAPKTQRLVIR